MNDSQGGREYGGDVVLKSIKCIVFIIRKIIIIRI